MTSTKYNSTGAIPRVPYRDASVTPDTRPLCRFIQSLSAIVAFSLLQPVPTALGQDTVPADSTVFTPVNSASGELLSAQNVAVTMRDGTPISLDIYRPAGNQTFPTLYAAGPYPLDMSVLEDTSSETGPVAWFVSQGYAVVLANVRGTGASGGDYTFFARQEQQDHYEIIQWITGQGWSNGQVAGTGAGYYAASQWHMALQSPPGLACIAPINGTLDPLREWVMPGGLANAAFINDWYEQRVRLPNAYARSNARLVNFDMRLAQLMHPYDDAWWRERNSIDSIHLVTVPVFALHDWSLTGTAPGLTSTLNALAGLNGVNKVLISNPAGELPLYQDTTFLARELLPYYRWCFNGRNPASPFVERPRVRYQVRGQDTIKRESTWPPGNTVQQAWFLDKPADPAATGRLATSQGAAVPGFTNVERTDSNNTLRFVTAPLEQDLEITGPVMLELYAASTTGDMAFSVTLKEANENPVLPGNAFRLPAFLRDEELPALPVSTADITETLVTHGHLKASSRLRDNRHSTEYAPVYALMGSEALSPGQVYRLDIALRQTAYRFRAGNRLVLEISPANDGSLAVTGRDTLYHSNRYPTRLWLPVVQSPQAPISRQRTVPGPVAPDQATGTGNSVEERVEERAEEAPGFFVPR